MDTAREEKSLTRVCLGARNANDKVSRGSIDGAPSHVILGIASAASNQPTPRPEQREREREREKEREGNKYVLELRRIASGRVYKCTYYTLLMQHVKGILYAIAAFIVAVSCYRDILNVSVSRAVPIPYRPPFRRSFEENRPTRFNKIHTALVPSTLVDVFNSSFGGNDT